MKIAKSLAAAVCAFLMSANFLSCTEDWGQQDPAAGNQTYPTRQVVSTYTFEYDEDVALSDMDLTNSLCEVVYDDSLESNVLHLDSTGYVRIANPFNSVGLQNGAAITFWVKTAQEDLDRALITFTYDSSDSAVFYFTPNGQLYYEKPNQLESLNLNENDPASYETQFMGDAGEWHFVALQITTTGYQFYVDNQVSISGTQTDTSETSFQYSTLVEFINNAPYIYIGAGSEYNLCEAWFDDITFIRNTMQDSDWNKNVSSGGDGSGTTAIYVGDTDYSNNTWWTVFSDLFTLTDGQTFHTAFYNYNAGTSANNWNNWLLVCTDGASYSSSCPSPYTGTAGEHFVIRADAYGWGDGNYNADNISSDYDWDTFSSEMNGAYVDLTVTKKDGVISMTATTTAGDGSGTVRTYTFTYEGATETYTGLFLTVELAYLEIMPQETYVGTKYNSGSNLVGDKNYSNNTWWTVFSDCYDFSGNFGSEDNPFVFHFKNYCGATANWNNWLLVCTDGGGYSSSCPSPYTGTSGEHFVLRSDAYGWGDGNYDSSTITANFDWDTYVSDMVGAEVWLGLYRSSDLVMCAKELMADGGTWFYDYGFTYSGASSTIGLFLTVELAYLDILDVAYYPYFQYFGKPIE